MDEIYYAAIFERNEANVAAKNSHKKIIE